MCTGAYVICTDLLGVLVDLTNEFAYIRDKDGVTHKVLKDKVYTIVEPDMLASNVYRKIHETIRR